MEERPLETKGVAAALEGGGADGCDGCRVASPGVSHRKEQNQGLHFGNKIKGFVLFIH